MSLDLIILGSVSKNYEFNKRSSPLKKYINLQ
jgi:hypothetical protein